MEMTARVRSAEGPLLTAMAIALAAVLLSLAFTAGDAFAQTRSNAQQEQAQALRNRGGLSLPTPPVGHYVADSGEAFTLDRSNRSRG